MRRPGLERQPRLLHRGRGRCDPVDGRKQLHQPQVQENGAQEEKEPLGSRPTSSEAALKFRKSRNRFDQFQVVGNRLRVAGAARVASHRDADQTRRRRRHDGRGVGIRLRRHPEKFPEKFSEERDVRGDVIEREGHCRQQ